VRDEKNCIFYKEIESLKPYDAFRITERGLIIILFKYSHSLMTVFASGLEGISEMKVVI